jgi:hypothetical protein
MNVVAPRLKVISVANPVVREPALPDGQLRPHTMGKASFDQPHRTLDRDALGSQQKVNVVRHDDKSVQFGVSLPTVLLQGFKKELCIGHNLKEPAAIKGRAGHKEGSRPVRT